MPEHWRELLAPRMVEAIDREISDAYRKGWEDCRKALLRALDRIEREQSASGSGKTPTVPIAGAYGRKRRAPRGFWGEKILEVLSEHGKPLTNRELIATIAKHTSYPPSRTSLYAALQALERQGRVVREEGRWRLGRDLEKATATNAMPGALAQDV